MPAAPALVSATAVSAADAPPSIQGNLCSGSSNLQLNPTGAGGTSDCTKAGTDNKGLNNLITKIVNYFSLIVGIIAVIMIIVGGFKYITSGGESSAVSGAKNTIIFALIGLIIVALAQFIVRFVLGTTTSTIGS